MLLESSDEGKFQKIPSYFQSGANGPFLYNRQVALLEA